MKTLRFIGTALLAVVLSVNLAACSDDDDDEGGSSSSPYATEILGLWECIETTTDEDADHGFTVGGAVKFFDGEFSYERPDNGYFYSGKKCFASRTDDTFSVKVGSEWVEVTDPTETQWNSNVIQDGDDLEFDYLYNLDGSSLTIMECDLDRWVGTISIEGDVMTFTYTYQNWNGGTVLMTEEYGPYTSKFQRQ